MVDLICIDVDGTLVGAEGVVPPEVWSAAERARARGIHLALCSGRPAFGLARQYAERLDPAGWHVFQNGASVLHTGSGESRSRGLAQGAVQRLVSTARSTGRVLELYTDDAYAVESTTDRARRHAGLLGVPFRTRSFDSLPSPIVRAQWVLGRDEVEAVMAEPHEELHLALSFSPVMPDTAFLNMTPPGIDKSIAVRVIAEQYGVTLERVMMVGDSYNDLEVMRAVGHPVAMGNAEPEVHAVARWRVADVESGGLAEALEIAIDLHASSPRATSAA